jgi:SAM-dependent methyltransferase
MPRFDASRIRRYYDRQTAGFVALGQGGSGGFIHRAVWGPGVATRDDAFHFVEDRVAKLVQHRSAALESNGPSPHIVDLGCGVGGSLAYLASLMPIRGTGLTISPVQARLARERIQALGLSACITCIEADYTQIPATVAPADVAFAIESFVHGPSAAAFFAPCARLVRPGGLLLICDDFRRAAADPRAHQTIERFRRGWHVNTLVTRGELVAEAQAAGFAHEASTDLTPWLELGRPRDRAIAIFAALFGWLPLERTPVGHVVGGSALQTCLARGWVGYELAVFRRLARALPIED